MESLTTRTISLSSSEEAQMLVEEFRELGVSGEQFREVHWLRRIKVDHIVSYRALAPVGVNHW